MIRGLAIAAALVGAVATGCRSSDDVPTPPIASAAANEADAENRLAQILNPYRAERYEIALAMCDALLESEPDLPESETVMFLAAESHYHLGQLKRALLRYRELHESFPYTRSDRIIARRLYAVGVAAMKHPEHVLGGLLQDRATTIEALGYVVVHFPRSPIADDAWLLLGEAHYAEGHFELAALAFERFLATYPDSALREDATFRVIEFYRARSKGPGYDAEPLVNAWYASRRYLREYETFGGLFVESARATRDFIQSQIVEHELDIAEFYATRKNPDGTNVHLENARLHIDAGRQSRGGSNSIDVLRPRSNRPPWDRSGPLPTLWLEAAPP